MWWITLSRLLQEAGADVHAVNSQGSTPLHWATYSNNELVIQAFLDAKASPVAVNQDSETVRKPAPDPTHTLTSRSRCTGPSCLATLRLHRP